MPVFAKLMTTAHLPLKRNIAKQEEESSQEGRIGIREQIVPDLECHVQNNRSNSHHLSITGNSPVLEGYELL